MEQARVLEEAVRQVKEGSGAASPRWRWPPSAPVGGSLRPEGPGTADGPAVASWPAPAGLLAGRGRQAVRQAIASGAASNGLKEVLSFLRQVEEVLENLLKIVDMVRERLEAPAAASAARGFPGFGRDSWEVAAKMIKMPEFQRLAAGMLAQMLKEPGGGGRTDFPSGP